MYIKPTDEFNFKGDEIISFTYEHLDAITMRNCVVRFKKGLSEKAKVENAQDCSAGNDQKAQDHPQNPPFRHQQAAGAHVHQRAPT